VYRRSGGHSYGATIPGPIGSVLTPGIDLHKYAALPFASTLCGSCTAVCPVKIDLDAQLYRWRQLVVDAGEVSATKRNIASIGARVLASPRLVSTGGSLMRFALRVLPAGVMRRLAGPWSRDRELPVPPAQSFKAWYKARGKQ